MTIMGEIWQSNDRVARVCRLTVIGTAAVCIVAVAISIWFGVLIAAGRAPWALLAVPAGMIIAAFTASAVIQGRAVRRHAALVASRVSR